MFQGIFHQVKRKSCTNVVRLFKSWIYREYTDIRMHFETKYDTDLSCQSKSSRNVRQSTLQNFDEKFELCGIK